MSTRNDELIVQVVFNNCLQCTFNSSSILLRAKNEDFAVKWQSRAPTVVGLGGDDYYRRSIADDETTTDKTISINMMEAFHKENVYRQGSTREKSHLMFLAYAKNTGSSGKRKFFAVEYFLSRENESKQNHKRGRNSQISMFKLPQGRWIPCSSKGSLSYEKKLGGSQSLDCSNRSSIKMCITATPPTNNTSSTDFNTPTLVETEVHFLDKPLFYNFPSCYLADEDKLMEEGEEERYRSMIGINAKWRRISTSSSLLEANIASSSTVFEKGGWIRNMPSSAVLFNPKAINSGAVARRSLHSIGTKGAIAHKKGEQHCSRLVGNAEDALKDTEEKIVLMPSSIAMEERTNGDFAIKYLSEIRQFIQTPGAGKSIIFNMINYKK